MERPTSIMAMASEVRVAPNKLKMMGARKVTMPPMQQPRRLEMMMMVFSRLDVRGGLAESIV